MPSRVYLRTLAQEAYNDEGNFDVMKKLNSEDVHRIVLMVLSKTRDRLQEGVNVVLEDFGVLQVKHPKAKTRRAWDISRAEVVEHKLKSKVHFASHFEVGEGEDDA